MQETPIPQAEFPGLPRLDPHTLHVRRERTLLLFAGLFLGAMAMLNILGITKFIELYKTGDLTFAIAVGVLPYPLTFLCTDFISEFWGRRTANTVVFVGLLVNFLVLGFITLGTEMKSVEKPAPFQQVLVPVTAPIPATAPDGEPMVVAPQTPEGAGGPLAEYTSESGQAIRTAEGDFPVLVTTTEKAYFVEKGLFDVISETTRMAVFASMIAYLAAQFIDVYLFHFWKRLTRGRHLWLRNNGSTLVSQLVDTTAVVLITFWASIVSGDFGAAEVAAFIGTGYAFKLLVALVDTLPFYLGVRYLGRFLRIDSRR